MPEPGPTEPQIEPIMNEEKDPLLMDHEADGIRELDNKLPRWWVWLFYRTIIFAVGYMLYYHTRGAVFDRGEFARRTDVAQYNEEMKAGERIKAAAMTKFEASIPTLQPSKDPAVIAEGKNSSSRCARRVIARMPADWSARTSRTITGSTAPTSRTT